MPILVKITCPNIFIKVFQTQYCVDPKMLIQNIWELTLFSGGGTWLLGGYLGGHFFSRAQKGRPKNFQELNFFSQEGGKFLFHRPKGGPEFFAVPNGGRQEKLMTPNHRQMAPLLLKNDSSLRQYFRIRMSRLWFG